MAVRYYSSLDTGAPVLPSTSGQRFFDNLRLILKACLVDGYGAKPAAGWTVGHEHADGFSLRNASGEGFVNVVSITTGAVAIYLMETISDGTAALASGYNRRSGPWFDGQADTGRQYLYGQTFNIGYANKQWCVVADERTAVFLWSSYDTAVDSQNTNGGLLYIGAYQPSVGGSGFCALGGSVSSTAAPCLASPSYAAGTVLRNPLDGTVVQGASPGYRAGAVCEASAVSLYNKTKLAPALLRPMRVSLVGRGAGISGSTSPALDTYCGLLRGLIAEPGLSDAYLSKVLPVLGVASPTYQDKIRPLTLPGGQQWVPLYPHISDLGVFVSLDPADWV